MGEQLEVFLNKHHFVRFTTANLSSKIYKDMILGLNKNGSNEKTAYQPMIPVYGFLQDNDYANQKVIVIDAGGTNFRSCLVDFDSNGKASISNLQKSSMPGIEKQLSKEEFYNSIADKIEYLKDKADKIGFCFSYAMEMTPENDGKVMVFSKEIKAPEVVGTYVGKELMNVLKNRGWTTLNKIVLLNDTVAALLSGFYAEVSSSSKEPEKYSSYIGFVFGTGINNAYIDRQLDKIVVCECGMFDNEILSSDFDRMLDAQSVIPGDSILEKMCSGAYMGKIAYLIIQTACEEHIFSSSFIEKFAKVKKINSVDLDIFLDDPDNEKEVLAALTGENQSDKKILTEIICKLIERSSSIVTAVLRATLKRCASGLPSSDPVCIVCNGSTFWKCHGLKDNVERMLTETISQSKSLNKTHFRIVSIENDITIGSALAAVRS